MVKTEQAPTSHSSLADSVRLYLDLTKIEDAYHLPQAKFDWFVYQRVKQAQDEDWKNVWMPEVFENYAHTDGAKRFLERFGAHVIVGGRTVLIRPDNLLEVASMFPEVKYDDAGMHNSGPGEHFLHHRYKSIQPNIREYEGLVVGTNIRGVRLDLKAAAIQPRIQGDLLRAAMLVSRG